jgi:hypothetical protein
MQGSNFNKDASHLQELIYRRMNLTIRNMNKRNQFFRWLMSGLGAKKNHKDLCQCFVIFNLPEREF